MSFGSDTDGGSAEGIGGNESGIGDSDSGLGNDNSFDGGHNDRNGFGGDNAVGIGEALGVDPGYGGEPDTSASANIHGFLTNGVLGFLTGVSPALGLLGGVLSRSTAPNANSFDSGHNDRNGFGGDNAIGIGEPVGIDGQGGDTPGASPSDAVDTLGMDDPNSQGEGSWLGVEDVGNTPDAPILPQPAPVYADRTPERLKPFTLGGGQHEVPARLMSYLRQPPSQPAVPTILGIPDALDTEEHNDIFSMNTGGGFNLWDMA